MGGRNFFQGSCRKNSFSNNLQGQQGHEIESKYRDKNE
jgi:hypothetical protein